MGDPEYIVDVLNKIKWDTHLHSEYFTIGYEDRVQHKIIEIPYNKIKRIEGTFLVLDNELGEEVNIPVHRIREVRQKGKLIWKRKKENINRI